MNHHFLYSRVVSMGVNEEIIVTLMFIYSIANINIKKKWKHIEWSAGCLYVMNQIKCTCDLFIFLIAFLNCAQLNSEENIMCM